MDNLPLYRFGTVVFFSGAMMTFGMYQLISGEDTGVYLPILTGIITYWWKQPSLKRKAIQVDKIDQTLEQNNDSIVNDGAQNSDSTVNDDEPARTPEQIV